MEPIIEPTNNFVFDYRNLKTLPVKFSHILGRSFIFDEINEYETKGLTSLQVKILEKKSHPLCIYWLSLKQAILHSQVEKVLRLDEHTIFLINLFFTLEQCRNVKNLNLVLDRLKKKQMFYSSCNELEVARYYLELGYEVEAVPESNLKTPDFLITTDKKDKLYVEAKLITDTKLQEDNQWQHLMGELDKRLIKYKKSLFIHVNALAPLKDIDQERILKLVEEYCSELAHKGNCIAKNKNVVIEISKISDWEHQHKDEIKLPNVSELSNTAYIVERRIDGFIIKHLRSVNVTKFTKKDLIKEIRRNIGRANSQAINNYPLIVHIGLPNKKSKEIFDITDFVHEHFMGDISRNFEKINAVLIHASSIETNSKGLNPTREHRMIIPNFRHKSKLPESFKFGAFDTLSKEALGAEGSIEITYSSSSSIESMNEGSFSEILFLCSCDAQVQIKLMLTSYESMRLQLVSPQINVRNFDLPINSSIFSNGSKLSFIWNKNFGEIQIDGNLIRKINFS